MIEIIGIPALKDNYIWMLYDPKTEKAIVVDPGEADPVLKVLSDKNLALTTILLTHHHSDHCGGVPRLLEHFKVPVYGSKREDTPYCTHPVEEGDIIDLRTAGLGGSSKVLDIPGHTLGHIAYVTEKMLFCGDTLFTAGCGRLFEGTAEMMYHSLSKLKSLPVDTKIYCGHEYTLANLRFALSLEPNNEDIVKRFSKSTHQREKGESTVPSTLDLELKTNPFLRTHVSEVIFEAERISGQKLLKNIDIFRIIRKMKDEFRG